MKHLSLITIPSLMLLAFHTTQAVDYVWDNGVVDDNTWGATEAGPNTNWTPEGVPTTNADTAAFNGGSDLAINLVDGNYTVNRYIRGGGSAGFTNTVYAGSGGSLTIDVNSNINTLGIQNNTSGAGGGTLRFNNIDVIINNTGQDAVSDLTYIRNDGDPGNIILFDTTSKLTITTRVQIPTGGGGSYQLNGTLDGAEALQINTPNISFGTGHDSSTYANNFVILGASKIAVNGGNVLSTGRRFQVNTTLAELELNGAETINDAGISVAGTNNFLLDVNADQTNMGPILAFGGTLTIELDPSVSELAFDDSSANETAWTGTITVTNFRNKVIRFGTDNAGLTAAQLADFGPGFSLDAEGYLFNPSFPDPTTIIVTLEMSTDLINWVPADEGAYLVYPGEEVFFRARIEPAL